MEGLDRSWKHNPMTPSPPLIKVFPYLLSLMLQILLWRQNGTGRQHFLNLSMKGPLKHRGTVGIVAQRYECTENYWIVYLILWTYYVLKLCYMNYMLIIIINFLKTHRRNSLCPCKASRARTQMDSSKYEVLCMLYSAPTHIYICCNCLRLKLFTSLNV